MVLSMGSAADALAFKLLMDAFEVSFLRSDTNDLSSVFLDLAESSRDGAVVCRAVVGLSSSEPGK
jgi:hypothetical protein